VSDDSVVELVRCGRYRKSATRRAWLQDFHKAWREGPRGAVFVDSNSVTDNFGVREMPQF
jgi:hypothetical protein